MKNTKKDVARNPHVNEVMNEILNSFIANSVIVPINVRSLNKERYEAMVCKLLVDESGGEELIGSYTDEL
jgi:hypothetical protein